MITLDQRPSPRHSPPTYIVNLLLSPTLLVFRRFLSVVIGRIYRLSVSLIRELVRLGTLPQKAPQILVHSTGNP